MRRIIFLFLILVGGCVNLLPSKDDNPEFIDKRFNNKFISTVAAPWDVYLTPYTIVEDCRCGAFNVYYDCKVVENKIGLVKMECQRARFIGSTNEDKAWRHLYVFEMGDEKDDWYKGYFVNRTNYSWYEKNKEWHASSGDPYRVPDGKDLK